MGIVYFFSLHMNLSSYDPSHCLLLEHSKLFSVPSVVTDESHNLTLKTHCFFCKKKISLLYHEHDDRIQSPNKSRLVLPQTGLWIILPINNSYLMMLSNALRTWIQFHWSMTLSLKALLIKWISLIMALVM